MIVMFWHLGRGGVDAAERDRIGKGGSGADAAPDMMSSILAKLRAQRQEVIARYGFERGCEDLAWCRLTTGSGMRH